MYKVSNLHQPNQYHSEDACMQIGGHLQCMFFDSRFWEMFPSTTDWYIVGLFSFTHRSPQIQKIDDNSGPYVFL